MTNSSRYHGARLFVPVAGAIQELRADPGSGNVMNVTSWFKGVNSKSIGVTNVYAGTKIAAVGTGKPSDLSHMRVFYQTTNGDIRSIWFRGLGWGLDPTTIAHNIPLGAPISAFVQSTGGVVVRLIGIHLSANVD